MLYSILTATFTVSPPLCALWLPPTFLDLCSDLPELEIVSLLSEGQPNYTLRADSVFGYDSEDWLHTPLLPPQVVLGLTHEQIQETLKYFCEFPQAAEHLHANTQALLKNPETSGWFQENNKLHGSSFKWDSATGLGGDGIVEKAGYLGELHCQGSMSRSGSKSDGREGIHEELLDVSPSSFMGSWGHAVSCVGRKSVFNPEG